MFRRNLRLALLVILGLLLQAFFVSLPQTTASATGVPAIWNFPDVAPGSIAVHGDRSVTVTDCTSVVVSSSSAFSAITLNSSGQVMNRIPKVTSDSWYTESCPMMNEPSDNGTFYSVERNSNYTKYRFNAYRDGVKQWSTEHTSCSGQTWGRVMRPAIGYDGDIYATVINTYSGPTSCRGKIYFVGFKAQDGAVKFSVPLSEPESMRDPVVPEVLPYGSGVAVISGNTIYRFSYAGVLQAGETYTPSTIASGESIAEAQVTEGGRLVVKTRISMRDPACPNTPNTQTHLFIKDLGTAAVELTKPPVCSTVWRVFAAPNDRVVVTWTNYPSDYNFSYYSTDGTLSYSQSLMTDPSLTVLTNGFSYDSIVVDGTGDVVVRRKMYLASSSTSDYNIVFDAFDTAGNKTRLFSTSDLNVDTPGVRQNFVPIAGTTGNLSAGRLYVGYCQSASTSATSCATGDSPKVAVVDTSVGYDYPRSAIFTALSQQLDYVALGDSFSSGEGVPNFIGDSATNGCHRSNGAYAMQLDQAPTLNLNLRSFRACSGATTQGVINGWNGEPSQLASISETTDVITITIGGNNAGFGDYVHACFEPTMACDASTVPYQTVMNNIQNVVPSALDDLFAAMQARLVSNPGVKVYIVGYPYAVREHVASDCLLLTNAEQSAATQVTIGLNGAIADSVARLVDQRFVFVDALVSSPFEGHDLCAVGVQHYFNDYDPAAPQVYTAHPNQLGQLAYTELVQESIQ